MFLREFFPRVEESVLIRMKTVVCRSCESRVHCLYVAREYCLTVIVSKDKNAITDEGSTAMHSKAISGLDWMDWILLRKLVLLEHFAVLLILLKEHAENSTSGDLTELDHHHVNQPRTTKKCLINSLPGVHH